MDTIKDKFSTRHGYEQGRCNAKRKKHPGKLCRRYALTGHKRCRYHGGGWNTNARSREQAAIFCKERYLKNPRWNIRGASPDSEL